MIKKENASRARDFCIISGLRVEFSVTAPYARQSLTSAGPDVVKRLPIFGPASKVDRDSKTIPHQAYATSRPSQFRSNDRGRRRAEDGYCCVVCDAPRPAFTA